MTACSAPDEYEILRAFFRERAGRGSAGEYFVPEILVGGASARRVVNVGDPYAFFLRAFDAISELSLRQIPFDVPSETGRLTPADCVYQTFVRTFASLNGEIGTALKQIAFLPFLKERLRVTVLILLPTGVIGSANRKGRRGSPFAVRNPFDVDPSLGDQLLPDFSAKLQYRALVQACRRLKIRVGSVVPMTTLSIDSELFEIFPDLGFWWCAEPEERLYCMADSGELPRNEGAGASVACGQKYAPPVLSRDAERRFRRAPRPEEVRVIHEADGSRHLVADVRRGHFHERLTLANAFPDVMASDDVTYTWGDVAAVNYTRCVCPTPLGVPHEELYDRSSVAFRVMPRVIAWKARELGEQVFLIDVSPSVPAEVLFRARELAGPCGEEENEEVALFKHLASAATGEGPPRDALGEWPPDRSSNPASGAPFPIEFIAEELWGFDVKNPAFSAVVGPLVFCVAPHTRNLGVFIESLRHHLRALEESAREGFFLAGAGNHDTAPPLADYTPVLYTISCLLPGSVPMLFSGVEHYAEVVVNKEFGFNTSEELRRWRSELGDDRLALFNDFPLDWATLPVHDGKGRPLVDIVSLLGSLRAIRGALEELGFSSYRVITLRAGDADGCVAYERARHEKDGDALFVIANFEQESAAEITWRWGAVDLILSVRAAQAPEQLHDEVRWTLPACSAAVFGTPRVRAAVLDRKSSAEGRP